MVEYFCGILGSIYCCYATSVIGGICVEKYKENKIYKKIDNLNINTLSSDIEMNYEITLEEGVKLESIEEIDEESETLW